MDQLLNRFSYLKSTNLGYIDELFANFLKNPESVDPSWRYFFEGLELGMESPEPHPEPQNGATSATSSAGAASSDLSNEAKVADLINAYREMGRILANVNPLTPPPSSHPLLDLARFQLTSADLDKSFNAGKLLGAGSAKLKDIITRLKDTYCSNIGVEFTHIEDLDERRWLEQRMEGSRNRESLDTPTRQFILSRLTDSETFERFLHTRYVAQKRFSIEGGESTIPILDCMIEVGADLGAQEFVIGMAHRGRLNVLVNLLGKKPEHVFMEFEAQYKTDPSQGEGDVKYHMGYSHDIKTRNGKPVHLSLGFNPSHLEFINPVTEGVARAKQTFIGDTSRSKVVPVQIHGDAAFAGQGVCYETLNLSQLKGYATGGTLHVVINNQVGFTTSPKDSRSTTYCTDMAKMLESPIFHVNGDDPEAIWYVAKLCMEYRQKFKKDVFIDLVCYRKHGHNEGDEPTFTQPLLYKQIKEHPSTREIYAKRLAAENAVSADQSQKMIDDLNKKFMEAQAIAKTLTEKPPVSAFESRWKGLRKGTKEDNSKKVETAVSEKTLKELAAKLNKIPGSFHLHPKLTRFFEARQKAIDDGKGIDWGNGEVLAFASLLFEGHSVRVSGQDAERGTFTHRHSVLNDFETGETYTPLNQLGGKQGLYQVHNSHLSETAVLGFEYGYAIADPTSLVIWEAQFGDFANGAQVIIDQFISSSESKWLRTSGLVMLLPHGFEGQGPEHSSARLERFLQLCGRNNMIVCNLTTPAQIFHALRRQLKRDFRKPLVIMSPKSLLRNPLAVSELKDFTSAGFQELLGDNSKPADVKRVLLCSGKIYYELQTERNNLKRNDVAILRVEQLYPWPGEQINALLTQYKNAKEFIWVQEEPRNMGAWNYVYSTWSGGRGDPFAAQMANRQIRYVGRGIGAAPAVGSHKLHEKEQKALIDEAFGGSK